MELWISITFAAAFLQNLRSALQKHLKGAMSTMSATFVRFGFGLPFAFLFLGILYRLRGDPLPVPNLEFLFWAIIGGGAQIGATFLLVHLFSFRNFVVGTAYSRTEPAQAAVFGLAFLGEAPPPRAILAILLTVLGVMLISVARSERTPMALLASVTHRTALIGIASGTLFGLAAIGVRGASLSLGGPNFLMQAAYTLCVVITLQTLFMGLWIIFRERGEISRILTAWRPSLATGLFGATASFGWFTAMTLQQAALVKAVAQIEIVFTIVASTLFFRESVNARELAGTVMIVGGILLLVLL